MQQMCPFSITVWMVLQEAYLAPLVFQAVRLLAGCWMIQDGGTGMQTEVTRNPAGDRSGTIGTISTAEAMLFPDSGSRMEDTGII